MAKSFPKKTPTPAPAPTPPPKKDNDDMVPDWVLNESKRMRGMKKGGMTKKYAKGGGIESKGKTRGRMC